MNVRKSERGTLANQSASGLGVKVRDCSATPGGWLGCSDCLLPGLPAIQGWSKWQVETGGDGGFENENEMSK